MSCSRRSPATTTARSTTASPLRLHGVDLVDRPALLPPRVDWSRADRGIPYAAFDRALVVAWELLDTVPCPVLEVDDGGRAHRVLVDARTGRECLGGPPGDEERRWCARWWPLDRAAPGTRAEVGLPREAWWQGHVRLLSRVGAGLLLAVDYAHTVATRPPLGTLSGYRSGRLVPPVPDGSCDVTAHVALDAVEDAGRAAGAFPGVLLRQDAALRALGTAPDSPGAQELLDDGGLGGFTWLLQGVGRPTPELLDQRRPRWTRRRPRWAGPPPGRSSQRSGRASRRARRARTAWSSSRRAASATRRCGTTGSIGPRVECTCTEATPRTRCNGPCVTAQLCVRAWGTTSRWRRSRPRRTSNASCVTRTPVRRQATGSTQKAFCGAGR